MSIKDWVREKEMLGGRFFTFEEVRSAVPELSSQVVKNSLNRLRKSSRIYSPYRGFYVILPPEYVRRGGVPPTFYMDDFMKSVHRNYYFSLLSAATFWGAAHQRPQVDFVTTDGKRLFAGVRERRDVEWIGMGRHLNCGGDFGAERRCFGELSKKQDDDMDNLKVWGQSLWKARFARGSCVMPLSAAFARIGDGMAVSWLVIGLEWGGPYLRSWTGWGVTTRTRQGRTLVHRIEWMGCCRMMYGSVNELAL